jgi:sulfur carrier protein
MLTQGISESPSHTVHIGFFNGIVNLFSGIMQLFINSEPKQFSGKNISQLIHDLKMPSTNGIALAVNDKVISKAEWNNFLLNDNDKILIIQAAQGG